MVAVYLNFFIKVEFDNDVAYRGFESSEVETGLVQILLDDGSVYSIGYGYGNQKERSIYFQTRPREVKSLLNYIDFRHEELTFVKAVKYHIDDMTNVSQFFQNETLINNFFTFNSTYQHNGTLWNQTTYIGIKQPNRNYEVVIYNASDMDFNDHTDLGISDAYRIISKVTFAYTNAAADSDVP